jgi:hypothetical protein
VGEIVDAMMVEFVGSTGAGKTTVAAAVERRLAGLETVAAAPDLLASLVGLPPSSRPLQRNLVCDLVGLPYVLGSLHRHGAFLRFCLATLARQRLSLQAANRVRSTLRKVGVYEIVRRHGNGRIVLVDEGTVLHAHNLFIFESHELKPAELERFASVVPLPDLIVHVKAPLALSVRRCLERPDPPRELRARDPAAAERYLGRAAALFEALVELPRIRGRVVAVDNPGGRSGAEPPDVDELVRAIRAGAAARRPDREA